MAVKFNLNRPEFENTHTQLFRMLDGLLFFPAQNKRIGTENRRYSGSEYDQSASLVYECIRNARSAIYDGSCQLMY